MSGKTLVCVLASLFSQARASDWEKVWGPVEFVVVDHETGAVYGKPAVKAGLPKDIYVWSGEPMKWTPLGNPAKTCVTAGWKPHNALFCLADDGTVHRLGSDGKGWKSIGGPVGGRASNVYGGPDALLALAPGTPADVYRYDEQTGLWKKIGGPGKAFVIGKSSDVEFKTAVYGLSPADALAANAGIYQWRGSWYKIGGPAASAFASHTYVFASNPSSGDVMMLTESGWKRIGGPGKTFAADGRGRLFGLSPDGAPTSTQGVYAWTGTPNKWKKIGGPAGQLYAGWDNLVFATNPDTGDLWHYRPACPPITQATDFSGAIAGEKLKAVSGIRKMLAILWDPHRPDHLAPNTQELQAMLFGPRPSLRDWYAENSGGKMTLVSPGMLGWYSSLMPADHYWRASAACEHGFVSGHVEKWTEAINDAAKQFDFASYDKNKDKVLTPDELAIFILIPQNSSDGYGRPTAGRQVPTTEPLVVQGVKIPWITEWYIGNPPNFGTALHESAHLLVNMPDMYFTEPWPYAAAAYSLGDQARSVHLDPYEKLKLGWLKWKVASQNGTYTLNDVETSGDALILYDPRRGASEYFILENRWRGSSYDAGVAAAGGEGPPSDGLAIWHIVEDESLFRSANTWQPGGGWGRWAIRMIRANGGTPVDDTAALFSKSGTVVSDVTSPASLHWLDGGGSGLTVRVLTDAGPNMKIAVERACY